MEGYHRIGMDRAFFALEETEYSDLTTAEDGFDCEIEPLEFLYSEELTSRLMTRKRTRDGPITSPTRKSTAPCWMHCASARRNVSVEFYLTEMRDEICLIMFKRSKSMKTQSK